MSDQHSAAKNQLLEQLKSLDKRTRNVLLFKLYLRSPDNAVKFWITIGCGTAKMPLMMIFHGINMGLIDDIEIINLLPADKKSIRNKLKKLIAPELKKYAPELLTKASRTISNAEIDAIKVLRCIPMKTEWCDPEYSNFVHPCCGCYSVIDASDKFEGRLIFTGMDLLPKLAIARDDVEQLQKTMKSDSVGDLVELAARIGSAKCFKYLTSNNSAKSYSWSIFTTACCGGNQEIIDLCRQSTSDISIALPAAIKWMHMDTVQWLTDVCKVPVDFDVIASTIDGGNYILFAKYLQEIVLPSFRDTNVVIKQIAEDSDDEFEGFEEDCNDGQTVVDPRPFLEQLKSCSADFGRNFLWMLQNDPAVIPGVREFFLTGDLALRFDDLELVSAIGQKSFDHQDIINAAKSNSVETLIKFRTTGVLRQRDTDGCTPLMSAIDMRESYASLILLALCADEVNAVDSAGRTVLHHAALQGLNHVVQGLVNLKADVTAVDKDKRTILMFAAAGVIQESEHAFVLLHGHRKTIEMNPETAIDTVTFLLTQPHDIHARDFEGMTALMHAANVTAETCVVPLLVKAGARVDDVDNNGKTALMYAAQHPYDEVCMNRELSPCELLLLHGANVNMADKHGKTALMYAIECDNDEDAVALCRRKANVNAADNKGATPLMYARYNPQLAAVLKHFGAQK